MLKGVNGLLRQVSGLQNDIEKIKNLDDSVKKEAMSSIPDDAPSFESVLNRKKADGAGEIAQAIEQASNQEGISEDLIRSVVEVESNFDSNAVSEDGAKGLMQIMPDTADELGIDPENNAENILGGTRYLGTMMDRFGTLDESLAAYNAGPGAVEDHGGVPPFSETQDYVKQVKETFRQLKGQGK